MQLINCEYKKYMYSLDSLDLEHRLEMSRLGDVDALVQSLVVERCFKPRSFAALLGAPTGSFNDIMPRSLFNKVVKSAKDVHNDSDDVIADVVEELKQSETFKIWYELGITSVSELSRYYLYPQHLTEFIMKKLYSEDEYETIRHRSGTRKRPDQSSISESVRLVNAESFTKKQYAQMVANQVPMVQVCSILAADFDAVRRKIMTWPAPETTDVKPSEELISQLAAGEITNLEFQAKYLCTPEQLREIRKQHKIGNDAIGKLIAASKKRSNDKRIHLPVEFDIVDQVKSYSSKCDSEILTSDDIAAYQLFAAKMLSSGYRFNEVSKLLPKYPSLNRANLSAYLSANNYVSDLWADRSQKVRELWREHMLNSEYADVALKKYSDATISHDEFYSMTNLPTRYKSMLAELLDAKGLQSVNQIVGSKRGRKRSVNAFKDNCLAKDPDFWEKVVKPFEDECQNIYEFGEWLSKARHDKLDGPIVDVLKQFKGVYGCADKYPHSKVMRMFGIRRYNIPYDIICQLGSKGLLDIDSSSIRESEFELKVRLLLEELGLDYKLNDRDTLKGLEIDLVVPSQNIGIEVSPNQTHNSNRKHRYRYEYHPKQDDYHVRKFNAARDANYELISLHSRQLDARVWPNISQWLKRKLTNNFNHVSDVDNCAMKTMSYKDAVDFASRHDFDYDMLTEQMLASSSRLVKLIDTTSNDVIAVLSIEDELMPILGKQACTVKYSVFNSNYDPVDCAVTIMLFARDIAVNNADILTIDSNSTFTSGSEYEQAGWNLMSQSGPIVKYVSRRDSFDVYGEDIVDEFSVSFDDDNPIYIDRKLKHLSNYNDKPFDIDKYIETQLSNRIYKESWKESARQGYDRVCYEGFMIWYIELA